MPRSRDVRVGYIFDAKSGNFQKVAADVGKSTKQLAKETKEAAGVFNEFGDAIGGIGGEITSMITQLATASGPIAILTAAIGGIALAWKRSQENIDLYLKSADKIKFGTAGFTKDAGEARVDVRRRAGGEIARGLEIMRQSEARLIYAKDLTEEQRKELELLKQHGYEMMIGGRALMDQVKGSKARVTFELEYSKLLFEQEQLKDSIKGIEEVRWKGMDAEFAKLRLISKEAKTGKEQEDARLKAQELSKTLLEEKTASIDKEIAITTKLSQMTETQEVTEERIFELNLKKAALIEQYAIDLLKVNRFMKDGLAITKEQLQKLKEFYTHTSKGYKEGNEPGAGKGLANITKKLSVTGNKLGGFESAGIQPYGSYTSDEIKQMLENNDFEEKLEGIRLITDELQSAFASMFTSISSGSKTAFEDMAKAFSRAMTQMLAQMAAKAAIFGLLNLLSGGSGKMGSFATELIGGKKLGKFLGFAGGTNFAPGGIAVVGERGPEVVNLPRGSRVTPTGGNIHITVDGRIKGKDLALVLNRYNSEFYATT